MTFEMGDPQYEFEEQLAKKGNQDGVFQRRALNLTKVLRGTSPQANTLRNAAGLLCDAVGARQGGKAITFAFISMEAVLLAKSDSETVRARLSEAVVYRLGESAESREQLRKRVKRLYDVRSSFVHTGEAGEQERWNALRLAVRYVCCGASYGT